MRRVCLVGAGFIARTHAEVLHSLADARATVIVDPNQRAAEAFARTFKVEQTYISIEEALRGGGFDSAHVLVPPPLHYSTTLPIIEAGIPVLVEKPLAANADQARGLAAIAAASNVVLAVNQNALYNPAFVRLRETIAAGTIGNVRFLSCHYHMPLRQLATGQLGHWMFEEPQNMLLEQAVHPLSQIVALAGEVTRVLPLAGEIIEITAGKHFYPSVNVSFNCSHSPAQLHFAVGESFPVWQISVIGDDGTLTADILSNRLYSDRRTRWIEPVDRAVSGWRTGAAIISDSSRNFVNEALSMLHLRPRSNGFFRSMYGSIARFYEALATSTQLEANGSFGADLVGTCEAIAEVAYSRQTMVPVSRAPVTASEATDLAVLGGTGFIGRHLVAQLLGRGNRISVMARSIRNLPEIFHNPDVSLHCGDIADPVAVAEAIGQARIVVNLAHGGGGSNWEEISRGMVGGAETVARVCLEKGVQRLVHLSSIAALYLGPRPGTVTGTTPSDPLADARSDYSRAKALCERMLFDMHKRHGLPIVILRPGIVVGAGTSPFHSGLGTYNNEQHCLGWNDGRNPLPFVLVEDVAAAIARACDAPGCEGRAFNLVGDVRLSAREFTAALGARLHRPLHFHPQSPLRLWLVERAKWVLKRLGGRRTSAPTLRDLRSRGLSAPFDCSDTAAALGWQPVGDRETFLARALPSTPIVK